MVLIKWLFDNSEERIDVQFEVISKRSWITICDGMDSFDVADGLFGIWRVNAQELEASSCNTSQ